MISAISFGIAWGLQLIFYRWRRHKQKSNGGEFEDVRHFLLFSLLLCVVMGGDQALLSLVGLRLRLLGVQVAYGLRGLVLVDRKRVSLHGFGIQRRSRARQRLVATDGDSIDPSPLYLLVPHQVLLWSLLGSGHHPWWCRSDGLLPFSFIKHVSTTRFLLVSPLNSRCSQKHDTTLSLLDNSPPEVSGGTKGNYIATLLFQREIAC